MYDVYNTLDFLPTNEEANQIIDSFDRVTSSIKQEPRWIPVTERLPEESDDYLITNIAGDVEMAYFAHPKDYAISKGEWREICYEDDVIAWMPLPEPYKTESEVEDGDEDYVEE